MNLHRICSITSSAPPPMLDSRPSRLLGVTFLPHSRRVGGAEEARRRPFFVVHRCRSPPSLLVARRRVGRSRHDRRRLVVSDALDIVVASSQRRLRHGAARGGVREAEKAEGRRGEKMGRGKKRWRPLPSPVSPTFPAASPVAIGQTPSRPVPSRPRRIGPHRAASTPSLSHHVSRPRPQRP